MTSGAAPAWLVVFAWVWLALVAPGSAAAQDETPAAVLTQARLWIEQGTPQAAIAALSAIAEPRPPQVSLLLGVAYYHADDHPRAIAQLTPVVDQLTEGSIEWREAVQVLGLSRFVMGRFPEALPLLEATRVWAADNAELGYVLGQAYVQTRQPDRARETFARTFRVAADSAAAHLLAAQMMIRLEFESQAEAELTRAIEKDPKVPRAHALLGQLALFRGRLDEAVLMTEREISLNPGDAMAFSQLGDARLRQLRWDEGIDALQKSIWLNPYYSAPYILLGKAYMKKGQPATAEGMLTRAIQYDPNNRSAHYLLGQLLQQMGREADAKVHFAIAERLQGQPGR
jgi:tetratricopeptide (TPR) repeat protein